MPSTAKPTPFQARVAQVIRKIPKGTVLSYGQVAVLAGKPGAPRAVVQALNSLKDVPWWRVARANRTLAPQVAVRQARLLRAEGATVRGGRVEPLSASESRGKSRK